MKNKQKILVIIPAFNEEGAVGKVVHLFFTKICTLLVGKKVLGCKYGMPVEGRV